MQQDSRRVLHKKLKKENHISVTCDPEEKYLAHFTPDEPIHPENQHLFCAVMVPLSPV